MYTPLPCKQNHIIRVSHQNTVSFIFQNKKRHVYFVEPILFIVNATWQTISSGTEQHFFYVSRELSEMKNKKIASARFWICVSTMFDLGYVDQRFSSRLCVMDSVDIFVLLGQRMQCKNATFSCVIEYLSNGRIGLSYIMLLVVNNQKNIPFTFDSTISRLR